MHTHDCKAIRREIDEANLDDHLTLEINEHLRRCDACRRFHDDRRTLRGLMAGLETVGAPADFDFRLRARLAREKPSNGFGRLLLTARPIAALALVVLIAAVAVVVKNRLSLVRNQPMVSGTVVKERSTNSNLLLTATPLEIAPPDKNNSAADVATGNVPSKPAPTAQRNVGSGRNIVTQRMTNPLARSGQRVRTRDSAGTGAIAITPDSPGALVVVPVDQRTFTVSIDNGRGGARTISLPPVSFGSQRLLAREASFMPVSSAKGNW